jgi:hypothetical protein
MGKPGGHHSARVSGNQQTPNVANVDQSRAWNATRTSSHAPSGGSRPGGTLADRGRYPAATRTDRTRRDILAKLKQTDVTPLDIPASAPTATSSTTYAPRLGDVGCTMA